MTPSVEELYRLDVLRQVVHHGGRAWARCACGELLGAHDNGTSIRWAVSRHNRTDRHQAWRRERER